MPPTMILQKAANVVLNVLRYFQNEYENPSDTSPIAFLQKTADATGVNKRTISRLKRQHSLQLLSEKSSKAESDDTRQPYKVVDDFDNCVIRRKVREFYILKHQLPTIEKLHSCLAEEINFPGSKTFLRNTLKKLGFKWKKSTGNRKLLMEKTSVVNMRCQYLRQIKDYRAQGMAIVYLDETWVDSGYTKQHCWQGPNCDGIQVPLSKGQRLIIVHAGGKNGFVQNSLLIYKASSSCGDYHNEMNGANFEKWITEKLLPNLTEKSIIVMDNASYHSVHSEKCPTSNTRKADIQAWLSSHGVAFDDKMVRAELLTLVKRNKPDSPVFKVDQLVSQYGHKILRLPPYHCDLNPIELIWANVKQYVASRNFTYKLSDVQALTEEAFRNISASDWQRAVDHVVDIEEGYRKRDLAFDEAIEPFIINLTSDSSSDSVTDTASETE